MLREGLFDHHRTDTLALVAAGNPVLAQAAFGPVPEGYAWYVELATYLIAGNSHTAIAALAVTPDNGALPAFASWDGQGLKATNPAATLGSWSLPLPIYVPPSHFLRVILVAGTIVAGDTATATFQTAVHQLNPRAFMSPDDQAQVAAAHQRAPEHLFAESAVASRRAV